LTVFDFKILTSEEIYNQYLKVVGDISFTRREIDIIACLMSGRSAKTNASFLKISPKTVETHMRNILLKLGGNSRESVINFIEKSGKFAATRKHYQYLLIEADFEKKLTEISAIIEAEKHSCTLVYDLEQKDQALVSYLEKHLSIAGIKAITNKSGGQDPIPHQDLQEINALVYLVSEKNRGNLANSLPLYSSYNKIILISDKKDVDALDKIHEEVIFLDLSEQENYYFFIFEILETLLRPHNLEKLISDFKSSYKVIQGSKGNQSFPTSLEAIKTGEKVIPFAGSIYKLKTWRILTLAGICFLIVTALWFILGDTPQTLPNNNVKGHVPRSDLAMPVSKFFLPRFNIFKQLEESFKGSQDIRAVALIGIGGAGKTTLARQYARKYQSGLVWEFNAETNESLLHSFENLAYNLAQTKEDQRILRGIQDIRTPKQREESLMFFVQQMLKTQASWFLIFDNVEKFTDIHKYFPYDAKVWGKGKVIVTTRDLNIKNNSYLNNAIMIGELSAKEKLDLFMRIMNTVESFSNTQKDQAETFLAHIPPFPLDVSISSYYLKVANISYKEYLNRLNKYDEQFIGIQEELFKDTSDYAKTRYSIIATSLQKVIEENKEFAGLLLYISLLDYQDIPRNLLSAYKKDVVIDSFIYNLKKYSLITSDNPSSSNSASFFSLHRSTQEISRAYLTKELNLDKNNHLLQHIADNLGTYIAERIKHDDQPSIKNLESHCEAFLSHSSLWHYSINVEFLKGELGGVYYHLAYFAKAKNILEEIYTSSHDPNKYIKMPRMLVYLAQVYNLLGFYQKSEALFEQGLTIYEKHYPHNYAEIAWVSQSLAHVHAKLGNYKKAVILLDHSLAIYKKHFPQEYLRIAWALKLLGSVFADLGDYNKAQNLLDQSLAIYKKHHPESDLMASWTIRIIGDVYRRQGDYEKAKALLKGCLTTSENHYGKEHLITALVLISLGKVYLEEGSLELAEELLRRALQIFKKSNHPESYMPLESLANLYIERSKWALKQGDNQQAQRFKTQAIDYLNQALNTLKLSFPANSFYIKRVQSLLKGIAS
jgi:DNA-binding CsgD family transcriptional regulator/Tfp pilus assembly protein PilF